ncbi:MAG: hypothetical protein P4L67_03685 [Candidatus Pacebacteria bacterium]|nr:hypothetical protein [Candidatus Paceibacterota bacterium]
MEPERKTTGDMKKLKLPQNIQDTVSPATRLLEKRRIMYEVQEGFEREKQNYNQYDAKV